MSPSLLSLRSSLWALSIWQKLRPACQAEVPGQVNSPFPVRLGMYLSLLSVHCPEDDSL